MDTSVAQLELLDTPEFPPARSSPRRSRRRPPEVLTESEAIALIKACSGRAPTGIRNRALIAVLWRCGLRISEALALELRDLDLEAWTIRIRHGKGDRSRTVGLDEQTAALLQRWLDRRRGLAPGARAPIFCRLPADGSTPPTSVTYSPASHAAPGSTGACTRTDSGTPTPRSSPANAPRSTSSATHSDTPPSPSPTATYATSPRCTSSTPMRARTWSGV
jgi:hypothetical protein